jgi:hypothetical protein
MEVRVVTKDIPSCVVKGYAVNQLGKQHRRAVDIDNTTCHLRLQQSSKAFEIALGCHCLSIELRADDLDAATFTYTSTNSVYHIT